MGDSIAGNADTASADKPRPTRKPKSKPAAPIKTAHQVRMERLFEQAVVLATGGSPGKFHDPSLSNSDISNAFRQWQRAVPGYIQRAAVFRLIELMPVRDIASTEEITVDVARQRYAKAMTSFESIIAKMEGPDQTTDERSFVPMMRRVSADRDAPAFMMRKANAEIEKILLPEMHDAVAEIEFCYRYLVGEVSPMANMRAYGIVSGGGNPERAEERASRLLPVYKQWGSGLLKSAPDALAVCRAVVIDGASLRQAAQKCRLAGNKAAAKLLLAGLNDYCIRAGRGDVIGAYRQHDPGYAYVIGASAQGPFKVGYSAKPKARMGQLQDGHAAQLTLMFVIKTGVLASKTAEDEIRTYLGDHRIRADWYNAPLDKIIDGLRIIHPRGVEIRC